MLPDRKVGTGVGVGGLSAVLVWVGSLYGITIPAEVAVGATTFLTFVAQYLVPNR